MSSPNFNPFKPEPYDEIEIDGILYFFRPHPRIPNRVFSIGGGKSTVYQIENKKNRSLKALKVFKEKFREKRISENAKVLLRFVDVPGLQACERLVIENSNRFKTLVPSPYPELEYSVLMPWIRAPEWKSIVGDPEIIYSVNNSHAIAVSVAFVLANIEKIGIAHCDISSGNVLLRLPSKKQDLVSEDIQVFLVDVEDIYYPQPHVSPHKGSFGTSGYAHKVFQTEKGIWVENADRFAAAILITEILCKSDPDLRYSFQDTCLFSPEDLQKNFEVYDRTFSSLYHRFGGKIAEAFKRAWLSDELSECPPIEEWLQLLQEGLPKTHINDTKGEQANILLANIEEKIKLAEKAYLIGAWDEVITILGFINSDAMIKANNLFQSSLLNRYRDLIEEGKIGEAERIDALLSKLGYSTNNHFKNGL